MGLGKQSQPEVVNDSQIVSDEMTFEASWFLIQSNSPGKGDCSRCANRSAASRAIEQAKPAQQTSCQAHGLLSRLCCEYRANRDPIQSLQGSI